MAAAPGSGPVILALLAALGVGWWMWKKGELRRFDGNDLMIAGFAIVGLILTIKGNEVAGPTMLIAAAIRFAMVYAPGGTKRPHPMARDEALRILELGPNPDAATIRDAHRRLVSRVHPDRGGSAELAAQVNRARDVLLSRKS